MKILFWKPIWNQYVQSINGVGDVSYIDNDEKIKDLDYINSFDVVIPLSIEQTYYTIDKYIGKCKSIFLCEKDAQNVDVFNNKIRFAIYMADNDLTHYIPKTYRLCIDGTIYDFSELTFPCVQKCAFGQGGDGVAIIDTIDSINKLEKNYLIQEYIYSDDRKDYIVNFFVLDGDIISEMYYSDTSEKNSDLYIICGRLQNNKVVDLSHLSHHFNKVFKPIAYTGFACVDFKIVDGCVKIMEVNPRLGGTILGDDSNLKKFINSAIEKYKIRLRS
jgi:glutathione synthase/RimK-type ligase-like ATP-grasp enzyme